MNLLGPVDHSQPGPGELISFAWSKCTSDIIVIGSSDQPQHPITIIYIILIASTISNWTPPLHFPRCPITSAEAVTLNMLCISCPSQEMVLHFYKIYKHRVQICTYGKWCGWWSMGGTAIAKQKPSQHRRGGSIVRFFRTVTVKQNILSRN